MRLLRERDPVETQLRNLGDAGRSGVLRVSGGDGSGAFHLRDGVVVYAESDRVPGAADRFARWPDDASGSGPAERNWVILEATADAATSLLSGLPRHGRFKAATGPVGGPAGGLADGFGMPVAELLAEVARRQRIVSQMSTMLTADTPVARNPRLHPRAVQISAAQWALLVRMTGPRTARDLAMELGASVFTSTIEVFRLIRLGLVSAESGPGLMAPGTDGRRDDFTGPRRAAISYIRAVTQSA